MSLLGAVGYGMHDDFMFMLQRTRVAQVVKMKMRGKYRQQEYGGGH